MNRREALLTLGGGVASLVGAKAADNVLLGYGVLVGTNLREQDLASLFEAEWEPSPFEIEIEGVRIRFDGEALRIADGERQRTLDLASTTPKRAGAVDTEFDLSGGPLEQLASDLSLVIDGDIRFEFTDYETFFARLRREETRPFTVEALRNPVWRGVPPQLVEAFAGVDPARTPDLVEGLATGFCEHTSYDAARYVAASIEYHVLLGAANLRQPFESPTSFEALERGADTGLFCWDFTHRSIEAFQAISAHRQTVPTFGWEMYDRRHGHVYTALGSAYRRDGDLVVPVTFLDYSRATRNDDLSIRWLLGDGIDAYNGRHRVTAVFWH